MQNLSLQQRLLQKLSPQQIQVIKLLELPMLQLEQRIKKELEENPVLELEENEYGPAEEEFRREGHCITRHRQGFRVDGRRMNSNEAYKK